MILHIAVYDVWNGIVKPLDVGYNEDMNTWVAENPHVICYVWVAENPHLYVWTAENPHLKDDNDMDDIHMCKVEEFILRKDIVPLCAAWKH